MWYKRSLEYSTFFTLLIASDMAAESPDPKAFSSWEDAFKYPVPAVRGMEKQLRRDIDLNKERLRTLVGYVRGTYMQIRCSFLFPLLHVICD